MINWIKRNIGTLTIIAIIIDMINILLFAFSGMKNTLTYIGVSGAGLSIAILFILVFILK